MVIVFQDFFFVLARLTNNLCDCFSTKQSFKFGQPLFLLGVSLNFVKGRVQELVCIFLDVSIYRFSLCILDGKAKIRRVIILFLAQLKIDVHFL